mmetsp:Transcript_17031/g.34960  ORF Transcript_17031/g.34960 Transcript_17031/m.34960 type:complete len:429 (+) Transcript_17031:122-1408(+)
MWQASPTVHHSQTCCVSPTRLYTPPPLLAKGERHLSRIEPDRSFPPLYPIYPVTDCLQIVCGDELNYCTSSICTAKYTIFDQGLKIACDLLERRLRLDELLDPFVDLLHYPDQAWVSPPRHLRKFLQRLPRQGCKFLGKLGTAHLKPSVQDRHPLPPVVVAQQLAQHLRPLPQVLAQFLQDPNPQEPQRVQEPRALGRSRRRPLDPRALPLEVTEETRREVLPLPLQEFVERVLLGPAGRRPVPALSGILAPRSHRHHDLSQKGLVGGVDLDGLVHEPLRERQGVVDRRLHPLGLLLVPVRPGPFDLGLDQVVTLEPPHPQKKVDVLGHDPGEKVRIGGVHELIDEGPESDRLVLDADLVLLLPLVLLVPEVVLHVPRLFLRRAVPGEKRRSGRRRRRRSSSGGGGDGGAGRGGGRVVRKSTASSGGR